MGAKWRPGPAEACSVISSLLQVALGIAIAVTVKEALWTYTGGWRWAPSWWSKTSADNVCLMTSGSVNLCTFSYIVVAVGMVFSILALITQCCSRGRRGRCCAGLDLFFAVLLTLWWGAAATAAMVFGLQANGDGVPQEAARTAVWAMCWAEAALWITNVVLALCSRRAHRRLAAESELTASVTAAGGKYERYQDTPFNDKAAKWKEAKASYMARSAERMESGAGGQQAADRSSLGLGRASGSPSDKLSAYSYSQGSDGSATPSRSSSSSQPDDSPPASGGKGKGKEGGGGKEGKSEGKSKLAFWAKKSKSKGAGASSSSAKDLDP